MTKADFLVKGLRYELVDSSRPEATAGTRSACSAKLTSPDTPARRKHHLRCRRQRGLLREEVRLPLPGRRLDVEKKFALALLQRHEVKIFVKLPSAFTIPTPLGRYNPDWAVTVERPDGSRYIVFETKGVNETALSRPSSRARSRPPASTST